MNLAGNRLTATQNGALVTRQAYDAADQVVGWQYDAAGNLLNDGTLTSAYDALNRTVVVTTTTGVEHNLYTGDGTLVQQTMGSTPTGYVQDLAAPRSQILQTTQGSQTTSSLYGLDRLASSTAGTRTWEQHDLLGSVRQTLDDTGAPLGGIAYDPWGQVEAGTPSTFGFTGEAKGGWRAGLDLAPRSEEH